mmetsp:Transcript_21150/g.58800  ORF Transcript_21150/g.58800 Transcript_21150/m.58800 type:complete len:223 (-) Transcript_21150:1860-2528(-)
MLGWGKVSFDVEFDIAATRSGFSTKRKIHGKLVVKIESVGKACARFRLCSPPICQHPNLTRIHPGRDGVECVVHNIIQGLCGVRRGGIGTAGLPNNRRIIVDQLQPETSRLVMKPAAAEGKRHHGARFSIWREIQSTDDPITNIGGDFWCGIADVAIGFNCSNLGALSHQVYLAECVWHLNHDRRHRDVDNIGIFPIRREVWNRTTTTNENYFLEVGRVERE